MSDPNQQDPFAKRPGPPPGPPGRSGYAWGPDTGQGQNQGPNPDPEPGRNPPPAPGPYPGAYPGVYGPPPGAYPGGYPAPGPFPGAHPYPAGGYPVGYPGAYPYDPSAPFGYDRLGRPYSHKSKILAGVLQLLFGTVGAGRWYTGHVGMAVAQLLTCGGLGFWAIIDGVIFLASEDRTDSHGRVLRS
ncbi:TM2 domain-containing protein [Streptomyces sp. URMC 129]|uniref:TM2 domain-containing protein n=1 Tax=Streptomyces sp. URMC 129 TaxID=3423407 RepID=UPI003F1B1FF5